MQNEASEKRRQRWRYVFFSSFSRAEIACPCELSSPETLKVPQCSLCDVAEHQPPGILFFLIKDNSPRKPDRTLALPRRQHSPGIHRDVRSFTVEVREALWGEAIAKAKEPWGDQWGVLMPRSSTPSAMFTFTLDG